MLKEFLKKADFNNLNKKDFKKNFEYKNNCNLRKQRKKSTINNLFFYSKRKKEEFKKKSKCKEKKR